jgi:phage terminase large subunit-like protein
MSELDFSNAEQALKSLPKFDVNEFNLAVQAMGEDIVSGKADNRSMQTFLAMLEELEKREAGAGTGKWFVPGTPYGIENCPKHRAFFDAGAEYKERIFLASNRTGKSIAGAFEMACHLTGEYPDWWRGVKFDRPISAWATGATARTTRDVVQQELIGPMGSWGTGMIPLEKMGRSWALQGTPGGLDVLEVKHKSGGMSRLGFKNYEQSIDTFMGVKLDVVWLDEECPQNIYNECLMRTMTTHGIVMVTFTPLKGLTPFVVSFLSKAEFLAGARPITVPAKDKPEGDDEGEDARFKDLVRSKAVIQAGWDDAPWLEESQKAKMLDDTAPHLRAARSKGIPAMGSGNVYPIPFEEISCNPFKIPEHYKRMYALDVGWNRTAALWAAIDPDTDTIYIHDEHYMGEAPPAVHTAAIRGRGDWIPGVIDPASRGRSQIDGLNLFQIYKDMGLKLNKANNEVESGIALVWALMSTGRLKIFSNLTHFPSEYLIYRRDDKGRIVKEKDHLMDCLRYIVNNQIRAMSKRAISNRGVGDGSRNYDI